MVRVHPLELQSRAYWDVTGVFDGWEGFAGWRRDPLRDPGAVYATTRRLGLRKGSYNLGLL